MCWEVRAMLCLIPFVAQATVCSLRLQCVTVGNRCLIHTKLEHTVHRRGCQ